MFVIRAIKSSDADAFVQLAFEAGLGLISMPKNPQLLHEQVYTSEASFAKNTQKPGKESYLFVLENMIQNSLGGVCGIHATTGIHSPSVFFHIEKSAQKNDVLGLTTDISTIKLVEYHDGPTEICSLFLSRPFRHSGLGRLLSLSRLLFIASCIERFDTMVFADMRGIVENDNHCPFWDGVSKHFVGMDYPSLMQMKNVKNFSIAHLLPQIPIFIPLLPQDVQNAIGKVHQNTKPALNMLMQEGFCISDDISIYDGGPKIEVETQDIRTVKNSVVAKISSITSAQRDDSSFLVCNNKLQFRCCYGKITVENDGNVILSTTVASALQVDIGDSIRFIPHYNEGSL